MTKSELKLLVKDIVKESAKDVIKECIREVLMENKIFASMIREVIHSTKEILQEGTAAPMPTYVMPVQMPMQPQIIRETVHQSELAAQLAQMNSRPSKYSDIASASGYARQDYGTPRSSDPVYSAPQPEEKISVHDQAAMARAEQAAMVLEQTSVPMDFIKNFLPKPK